MNRCIILAGLFIFVLIISGTVTGADTASESYTNPSIPDNGTYVGAYLGGGAEDRSTQTIEDFNNKTGKKHSLFSRYVDISDSRNPSHWTWAEKVKNNRAMPVFIYDPYTGGLEGINTRDVQYFANKCRDLNVSVFVVFGHEMNIKGYNWGQKPELYKEKFKLVAKIFHTTAPLVQMCWVPNQNWGYPWDGIDYGDGYTEYYPDGGAVFDGEYRDYVDWVGLNFYDRDWDNNDQIPPDMFIANIKNGRENDSAPYINFYETFSVAKNKPMIITEIGAFDTTLDTASQLNNKNDWISQIYHVSTLQKEFPMIHAICYFNVEKYESGSLIDFRIPLTGTYKTLIADPYFIGASDFISPIINSIDPERNSTNVANSKVIKLKFNETIKEGNMCIELKNNSGKSIKINKVVVDNILIIDPINNLTESLYTLYLHTGSVTDSAGNPVTLTTSNFIVGSSPIINSSDPKNNAVNVARNKKIKVNFSENIKAGSNYQIELKDSSGTKITIKKSIGGKVLTISHTAKLKAKTKYKLTLYIGCVTDQAGNPLKAKTFTFTTGSS